MNGGDKEGLKAVPSHQAGKVLTAKYLNEIETAIKARTPLKGTNIDIIYLDGGAVISVTGTLGGEPFPLTICSNGTPSVVTVLTVI